MPLFHVARTKHFEISLIFHTDEIMNRDNAMKARYEIVMRDLCNSVTSQNVSRNSTRREHTVSVARGLIFRVRLRRRNEF